MSPYYCSMCCFFFQAEDGIRDLTVTGVQTCALPISRVTVAVHLEHAGERVLVARMTPERLAAVEDEFRLKPGEALERRCEILRHADHEDVVPLRQQRAGHVVFPLLDLRLHLFLVVGVLPVGGEGVEQHRNLHPAPRTRCLSRPTVVSAIRITNPPTAPADGSSSIAGRRPNRSER